MKHIINLRLVMLLLGVFLTTGAWAQVQYEAHMDLSLKDLYDVKTDFHGIKVPYEYSDPSQQVTVEVTTIKGGRAYLSPQCGWPAGGVVEIGDVLLYKLVQVSPSSSLTHHGEQTEFLKKSKFKSGRQQYNLCDKTDSSSPKFWKIQATAADELIYGKDPDGWWNWGANNVTVKILITLTGVPYSAIQQLRIPGLGDVALSQFRRETNLTPLTVKVYRSDNTTPIFSQAYNNDAVGSGLGLRMGDSVVFESPYPELLISGLADTWIARTAGESKYYCTPSIKMGGFRPFLGYDSKVHGVGMRKYPDGFDPNYPSLKVSNGNFSTYWIAQRYTSADAQEYDPFNIENGNVALSKVKDASDFGRDNFPIGGNESVTAQRNNQREGYNMQILDRFFTAMGGDPTDKSLADYAGLDLGGNYVAGLDGDELLYLNHKYARFNQQGEDDAITKLSVESWKKLWNANGGWESRDDDAVNWMVQTYQSNRMALLQGNDAFEYQKYVDRYSDHSTIYNGHEILDKKQYVYDPLELNPQAYFNHKRPVIHTPGGSPIPEKGKISWDDGISIHEFPLNVLFPSLYIRSFYGAIKGDRYPSRDQQNVFYRISKNIIDNQTAEGIYQLEYTFEDELGFLTKDVVNLSNSNDRRIIVGSKIGANFNIQGGGYHEITLTYRRNADASSVIIAGKELRVVDLRFVSAPGTKEAGDFAKDGSIFIANDALDLKEGRGDGKNWYLRERVAQTAADVNGYGDTDYGVTRTYVLAKGDRVVFNAIDADPHTFRHYDVEWYLSQRLMSKCLTDEELESRIAWTLSGPSQANGTGRHYAHTFETAGEYTLEATYGGTSTVKHKIIVHEAPYVNTPESEKGKIVFYDLSDVQKEWLREFTGSPDLDLSEAKVAKVQDIYSKYSYDEGPRAPGNNPENRENRYGPQNDFNASFAWTVPKCVNLYYIGNMVLDAVEQCTLDNQPEFFPDPYLDEFEPASSWFPKDWIRHFSDKPYPNDINSGLITDPESAVSSHWPEDVFEPWMWRLPWISRTQWHGYRTRWNIKAVYDMKRLFNDDLGAFSGEKFHLTDNPDAYRREVYGQPVSGGGYDGTKIVAGLDDTARKKYDFFWDLYAGRKLIIDATELHGPEHRRFEVRLINPADDNFTFIAAKIYGDPPGFLKGADMSSIKTQEAEGISWSFGGKQVDPYTLLGDFGANVVRFRVWLDPKYTVPGNPTWPGAIPNEFAGQPFPYNTVATVKDEIVRAKEQGLKVILDFHYSDTWTDPERNLVPTDWQTAIGDQTAMGDNLAVYTKTSLDYLNGFGALPDFVQIGNEINSNLLLSKPYEEMTLSEVATELGVSENQLNGSQFTINWDRNADLLNRGLSAVKDNYSQIQTILHVSGVATCTWWADQAFNENASNRLGTTVVNKNKVDIMAMSYYPGEKFSEANLTQLQNEITTIHEAHGVQVLVVETAYPASTKNSDYVNNLMGHYCEDIASSCNGDPYAVAGDQPCACIQWPENPTPKVQKDWLLSLKETLVNTPGAAGFVYWEPFWVGSKSAKSKDFKGSNWENMSFFQYEEGQAVDVNPLELNGGIQVFCDGPCPISPPLVRHLFDNNYEDASGNNISSVPQNNPGFVSNTAQGSRALLLSQTNYVDLDVNNAFIHDAFNERTVAFWVYSVQNIASITEDLYDEGGATHGIAIRKQGTTLELAVRNNRQQRTISSCFYRDEWIHVAGVFDNGKLQLYINGQLQAENPDVGYSSIPAHGNGAGFGKTNGENAFDQVSVGLFGAMDDLQVYGRALTADEVQYLVAQADITPDPDLCGTNSALSGSGGSSQVGEIGIVSLDVPANESLKVYPNPSADGNFVVTFDLPASATVGLEVSALDGRRLMTKSLNKLVAGQHRLQIEETQGLPPGMYLLKVDFGDHVEARKLVISN